MALSWIESSVLIYSTRTEHTAFSGAFSIFMDRDTIGKRSGSYENSTNVEVLTIHDVCSFSVGLHFFTVIRRFFLCYNLNHFILTSFVIFCYILSSANAWKMTRFVCILCELMESICVWFLNKKRLFVMLASFILTCSFPSIPFIPHYANSRDFIHNSKSLFDNMKILPNSISDLWFDVCHAERAPVFFRYRSWP